MYAILDKHGNLVTTASSITEAENVGKDVAGRGKVYADEAEGYTPNAELLSIAPSSMPKKALQASGLAPVSGEDILTATDGFENFEHCFKTLKPYFPKIEQYSTAQLFADAMIGQNYKTSKTVEGFDGKVMGLSLAPYWKAFTKNHDTKKVPRDTPNLCLGANAECRAACLVTSGRNVGYAVGIKYNRTRALYNHPVEFCAMLALSIAKFVKYAKKNKLRAFVRLNVYSDIPWELFFPDLFGQFPEVQFYDYTKVEARKVPENYDLTFSYSGTNLKQVERELSRGRRIAVVFLWKRGKEFPIGTFLGHKVVNGDISDLRPLDPPNNRSKTPVIVGLHYKAPKGMDYTPGSFIVPVQEAEPGVYVVPHGARQSAGTDTDA